VKGEKPLGGDIIPHLGQGRVGVSRCAKRKRNPFTHFRAREGGSRLKKKPHLCEQPQVKKNIAGRSIGWTVS
jgi:hypothetical protein